MWAELRLKSGSPWGGLFEQAMKNKMPPSMQVGAAGIQTIFLLSSKGSSVKPLSSSRAVDRNRKPVSIHRRRSGQFAEARQSSVRSQSYRRAVPKLQVLARAASHGLRPCRNHAVKNEAEYRPEIGFT